jgi:hypothetical protein
MIPITAVKTNCFTPSAARSPGFYHISLQHHLYHCSMSPCPVPSSLLITKLPPHVPTSHRYYCPLHTICSLLHITKLLSHVPTSHRYYCPLHTICSLLHITKLLPHVPTSHRYYCPLHTICSLLHITKLLPHVPTTSPMPAHAHGFIWLRQHQFTTGSYSIVCSYR